MRNAVRNAYNLGAILTGSMGNDYAPPELPAHPAYPAAFDSFVVAVGALAWVNNGDTTYVTSWQNRGTFIDVTAPGENVWTTSPRLWNPADGYYTPTGGTSFSTPQVAGLAALIMGIGPNITNAQVMNIIKSNATLFSGWETNPTAYGSGMINCYKALKYTIENYSTTLGGTGVTITFNENITTTSGTTLTILPGTIVNFISGASLTLNGSTVNLGTGAALTLNGGFNITSTSTLSGGTVTFNQNTTIPSGTTLNASNTTLVTGSGVTLTLNGGFTIGGTVSMGGTNGTVTFNQGLTTLAGTAFNIRAGTTVNIGYLKSLTFNGSFSATSATLASTNRYYGSWGGVKLYGGPNTINYAVVKYGNEGIYINNSFANTITGCTFDSCLNAGIYSISSNRNKGALTINGSTFRRMYARGVGIVNP